MAIILQLRANSTAIFNNGRTESVVLATGVGQRRMLVAVAVGSGAAAPSGCVPVSVTYGGVPMTLVTDGVNVAQVVRLAAAPSLNQSGVFWYELRESQLPANGAQNLIVSWPVTETVGAAMGWWILENCDQGINVRGVGVNGTTVTNTNLACAIAGGGLSDAVFVIASTNTSLGSNQITIGGIGLTEDFDLVISTGHAAAGTDLTAPTLAPMLCDVTYSSTNRSVISAVRLAEFFAPGGQCSLSQAPGTIVSLEAL